MNTDIYETGEFWAKNELMQKQDAEFKVTNILKLIEKHGFNPTSILDVGCGGGKNAFLLSQSFNVPTVGLDISKAAISHAKNTYECENLSFHAIHLDEYFSHTSLGVMLDVFEHVDDYIGLLRKARNKADYWVFNIPLDMNALCIIRSMEIHYRNIYGHLHYFSEKTALATLETCGYKIIDSHLAVTVLHELKDRASIKNILAAVPRLLLMTINRSFGVRVLGGASLVVFTKSNCD